MNHNLLPWENLPKPNPNELSTILVSIEHKAVKKEIFFAKDSKGSFLLLYVIPYECTLDFNQKMHGIHVYCRPINIEHKAVFLELQNTDDADIFYLICIDLCLSINNVNDDVAPKVFLNRLHYLQKFMKNKGDEILDKETQQGLIAELIILREKFFKKYDYNSAIFMWTGIEELSQDFATKDFRIEVKSIIKPAKNFVTISSIDQLEQDDRPLYLAVVNFKRASSDMNEAYSLYNIIKRIRKDLENDNSALENFNDKLNLIIPELYLNSDALERHYNMLFYALDNIIYFDTGGHFPKITKNLIPDAIKRISYSIDLSKCNEFEVPEKQVFGKLN